MLQWLLDRPDSVAQAKTLCKAVAQKGANQVAQQIAEDDVKENKELFAKLVRELQDLQDPTDIWQIFDKEQAAGNPTPHLAAMKKATRLRGVAMEALLQHEPFLEYLEQALQTTNLRNLGIGARFLPRIQETLCARGFEPPKKKIKKTHKEKPLPCPPACLLVASTWHPSSFVSIMCGILEEAGVACLTVKLEEKATRRKSARLSQDSVNLLKGAATILAEYEVYQVLQSQDSFEELEKVKPTPPRRGDKLSLGWSRLL